VEPFIESCIGKVTGDMRPILRNYAPGKTFTTSTLVGLIVTIIASTLVARTEAQSYVNREFQIKASVISLLGKFITWPSEVAPRADQPLVVGILGGDPFVEGDWNHLDATIAEDNRKGGNTIIHRFDSVSEYRPCHILFVSSVPPRGVAEQTLAERLAAAKQLTAKHHVLLVADTIGMAQEGIAANLVFDRTNNRVRLELNPDAANRAGLKLAPQLLRLSIVTIVRSAQ
jgi:hypothetical protein